jgi:hypothetical protein
MLAEDRHRQIPNFARQLPTVGVVTAVTRALLTRAEEVIE